jgi:hypothetical protein
MRGGYENSIDRGASRGKRGGCPSSPMQWVRSRDAPDGLGDTSGARGEQAALRALNNCRRPLRGGGKRPVINCAISRLCDIRVAVEIFVRDGLAWRGRLIEPQRRF